jgi:4-amino-4-deoxy-L-arabinose transferase-like glycosyltransferase
MLGLRILHGQSVNYDEGVYWQSLRAMAHGHPLFDSVFSSQPPLFLLSIYPFYMIFGQSLSAARLALIFFSLVGLTGVYVAGRALGHRIIGGVACLSLSLDPLYENSAHTLQAELPSLALQIWAVACAAQAMHANKRQRGWLAASAGVLLGCALLTKLFAIAALVPIVLYLGAPFALRWFDGNLRQPMWRVLYELAPTLGLLTAGLLGVIVLILMPFAGQLDTVYDQVVRFHLVAREISEPLRENLRHIGVQLLAAPQIYIAVLALLVITWQRMWVSVPLICWALTAFITLALQRPLFDHHVALLSPPMALISGCGVLTAWQFFSRPGRQPVGLAITLILLVLAGAASLRIDWQYNLNANVPLPLRTVEMVMALQGVSAPAEVILSDDQYVAALADRDLPPQLVDTSFVRIVSGYLSEAQLEDFIVHKRIRVILFASGRFDSLRGFRARVAQRYAQVAIFDDKGALFVLEPPPETVIHSD